MASVEEDDDASNNLSYKYWWSKNDGDGNLPRPAPVKLSESDASAMSEDAAQRPSSGLSKWNKAQTFEERDFSSWGEARIKEVLVGVEASAGGRTAVVKEVTNAKGDASIVVSRGKKRAGFDYEVTFKWTTKLDPPEEGELEGSATIPSASLDDLDEMELTNVKVSAKKKGRENVEAGAIKAAKALVDKLRETFEAFAEELKCK